MVSAIEVLVPVILLIRVQLCMKLDMQHQVNSTCVLDKTIE